MQMQLGLCVNPIPNHHIRRKHIYLYPQSQAGAHNIARLKALAADDLAKHAKKKLEQELQLTRDQVHVLS